MRDLITVIKRTDKKLWLGMGTMCVGWTLSLLGAHQDGVNDTVRAFEKQTENKTENKTEKETN